jgi:hypothetical protein
MVPQTCPELTEWEQGIQWAERKLATVDSVLFRRGTMNEKKQSIFSKMILSGLTVSRMSAVSWVEKAS